MRVGGYLAYSTIKDVSCPIVLGILVRELQQQKLNICNSMFHVSGILADIIYACMQGLTMLCTYNPVSIVSSSISSGNSVSLLKDKSLSGNCRKGKHSGCKIQKANVANGTTQEVDGF